MSEEERKSTPPALGPESWTLEDAPKPEEMLGEKLAETAEAMTTELQDLHEALVPPEPLLETPAPAVEVVSEVATMAADELPAVAVEPAPEADLPPVMAPPPTETPNQAPKVAPTREGNDDDRLMAALAWFTMVILQLPIVSIIQLLSANNKERPFQKYHAVTSLLFFAGAVVYEFVAGIAYAILGLVTLGIGYVCLLPIFFVPHLLGLYYAFQAYSGKRIELPVLSDLGRKQGWL